MRIIVFVGPALGIINHSIALSNVLINGGHEVMMVTSPRAKVHIAKMKPNFEVVYSQEHDINFDKTDVNRKPHLQQLCDLTYLKASVNKEIEICELYKPDFLITKHHFSIAITAKALGLKYAMYYTDGGEYLFPDLNPQARMARKEDTDNFNKACEIFNVVTPNKAVPFCIQSPDLNIIRGVPATSALTQEQIKQLPSNAMFGGTLTFDGDIAFDKNRLNFDNGLPCVYTTFGTIYKDVEHYQKIVDLIGELPINHLLACPIKLNHVPPNTKVFSYIPNNIALEFANVFIHHGGHGTMLSGLKASCPQIVIPENTKSSAQASHAGVISSKKLGVCLNFDAMTLETLQQAMSFCLSGDCKNNVREICKVIQKEDVDFNEGLLEQVNKMLEIEEVETTC